MVSKSSIKKFMKIQEASMKDLQDLMVLIERTFENIMPFKETSRT